MAYSRQYVNDVIHCIDGFNKRKVYYSDTDSLYILSSDLEILKKNNFVGSNPK